MKRTNKFLLCAVPLLIFSLSGCSSNSVKQNLTNSSEENVFRYSYADTYQNRSEKEFYCYKSGEGKTMVLDYESMKTSSLCSKPNCKHHSDDCIAHRLDGKCPMFGENCAYYFKDDAPVIKQDDEGKQILKLGSSLYRYDFQICTEEKLTHVDASVSDNCYGWMLLNNDIIYFIENHFNCTYDDYGNLLNYGNTGGSMTLCSVRLSDLQVLELCELYDTETLTRYFPLTPDSGEVYMEGLFDNKIYFNVCFVEQTDGNKMPEYRLYTTYYDLSDGTYHGTPDDYENIDYAGITYCSDDYLVICKEGQASVWKKGNQSPVVLWDERFSDKFHSMSIVDDTMFCFGWAFDLNTKEGRNLDALPGKDVVVRYGDSFIIADHGMQSGFEKIPAEQLLN